MPSRITQASAQKTAMPRMKKTLRESSGDSSSSVRGIVRQRQPSSTTDRPMNVPRMPTSHPVMPRSMKEWTEKSASTPERVRKVP